MAELSTMRLDGYLKIGDIPGDSERDGHEEEIRCHGVEFEMAAPHDPNSMARRGKVGFGLFTVIKHYDKSSPMLKMALWKNKLLGDVVFSVVRTIEEATADYIVVTLTDATVVSYSMKVEEDEGDLITDRISFAYKEIEFSYDDKDPQLMTVHVGA
jgi:type VI secretion system secreted protein Hcp